MVPAGLTRCKHLAHLPTLHPASCLRLRMCVSSHDIDSRRALCFITQPVHEQSCCHRANVMMTWLQCSNQLACFTAACKGKASGTSCLQTRLTCDAVEHTVEQLYQSGIAGEFKINALPQRLPPFMGVACSCTACCMVQKPCDWRGTAKKLRQDMACPTFLERCIVNCMSLCNVDWIGLSS